MIRGPQHVCVACRRPGEEVEGPPTGDIFVQAELITTFAGRLAHRYAVARWPLVRGTLVLLESMELGSKGLRLSAAIALKTATKGVKPSPEAQSAGPEVSQGETFSAQPVLSMDGGAGVEAARAMDSGTLFPVESGIPSARASNLTADDPGSVPTPDSTNPPDAAGVSATAAGVPMVRRVLIPTAAVAALAGVLFSGWRLGWMSSTQTLISAVGMLVLGAAGYGLAVQSRREEARSTGSETLGSIAVGATMITGLALGVGIFFMLPSLIAGLLQHFTHRAWVLNLGEGVIRVLLFFGYLKLISAMPNIHRLFQYHGAEHQVIHVHENGLDLLPENAARFPTIHPRCGTAFLAIVLVTSVIVFTFAGWQVWYVRLLVRLVGLPLIAGVSYELLKWNSVRPNWVLKAFVAPGLWFQRITTQPPSTDQVEVAIAAMQGVLTREQQDEMEQVA